MTLGSHVDRVCGLGYNTSDKSPVVPRGIGDGQACPWHGSSGVVRIAAGTRYVCTKCGLINERGSGRLAKHNGYKARCADCNMTLVSADGSNLYYCIKCGRLYDGKYTRGNSSGNVVLKCKFCGGNCRTPSRSLESGI